MTDECARHRSVIGVEEEASATPIALDTDALAADQAGRRVWWARKPDVRVRELTRFRFLGGYVMRGLGGRRLLVTLVSLALVAAACGNESSSPGKAAKKDSSTNTAVDQPGVTKDTIRVGGVASITNALNAPYGDIFNGVKAYFAMQNAQGGIYGRKLELVTPRDDAMVNNLKEVQGMLAEDNVFAAVGLATIFSFTGAPELAKAGIPSFGWNINAEWERSNLFGNSGALCLGCSGVELPWMAKKLDKKVVGVLAYNVADSKSCAEGVKKSFDEFPTAKVGFYSDSLSFGDVDFSVEIGKMKDAGVDFITTCMDTNGVLAIAKEARQQGLNAIQYLPNGYDQAFMTANGQFFEGSIVRVPFVPFETKPAPPGLSDYLKWMKSQGYALNEYATYGWMNAAMLLEGLEGAGPNFTQQKVVDALNKLTNDTGGGLLTGIDWTTQHTERRPPTSCAALMKVTNKKFVSTFVPKGKVFVCFKRDATPDDTPTYK